MNEGACDLAAEQETDLLVVGGNWYNRTDGERLQSEAYGAIVIMTHESCVNVNSEKDDVRVHRSDKPYGHA